MLALFPPLLWTTTTSLEEISISHNHEQQQQQSYVYKDAKTSESYLRVAPSQPQDHYHDHDDHRFPKSASFSCDPAIVVKKLNHNASERNLRKKMNTLYSSLRSLLLAADQTVIYSFSPLSFMCKRRSLRDIVVKLWLLLSISSGKTGSRLVISNNIDVSKPLCWVLLACSFSGFPPTSANRCMISSWVSLNSCSTTAVGPLFSWDVLWKHEFREILSQYKINELKFNKIKFKSITSDTINK